ncbi:hypothetical protein [Streptomyces rubradiris]|uniref:Uncharacterized protein n=1 Tax=Streptomyces rubradiris TaxID=285531 RepID=A0ABQ3R3D0_STRRR|nr:hypothetical protein [Streptomyces rubradiris]GHH29993.1 hypothetical protein GCM10018792_75830 [Streptomyces rubradiris]GHI50364.1 hypothetical protein Srubr_02100 [Streptomyces rubradiris]
MTVAAIIVLAVWALGIVALTVALAVAGREHPLVDAAMFTDPVRTCLSLALVTVFWPAAVAATGLRRLMERGQR